MYAFVCEPCWQAMKPRPKVLNKINRLHDELMCYECGINHGTLYVKVK